jgi:hypothetical protein
MSNPPEQQKRKIPSPSDDRDGAALDRWYSDPKGALNPTVERHRSKTFPLRRHPGDNDFLILNNVPSKQLVRAPANGALQSRR